MFDTLTPRSTTGEFKTMPRARPDPGGFLPEARTGAREAAAHMKDLAERFAELRNAIMRLPGIPSRGQARRAPPPASPSREHIDEREGNASDDVIFRHHGRQRRGPLTTRAALAAHNRATGCRRAMPPDSPACLDQRAREFEEGKEKGDAPKAKREFPPGCVSPLPSGDAKCSITFIAQATPTTPVSIPAAQAMPIQASPHRFPTPARYWPRSECRATRSAKFSAPEPTPGRTAE